MGRNKHSINLLFTLALLGIFAVSALSVAVLGAQVYGRTADQMDANYNIRTSLVYITEKVRQCPGKDIEIRNLGDTRALVLNQEIEGKQFESWIFGTDGKLREVLVSKGDTVATSDGQEIMDIHGFNLEIKDNLLEITVFDDTGDEYSVVVSVEDKV